MKRNVLVEVDRIAEGSRKPGKVKFRAAKLNGRTVHFRFVDAESADFTEQLTDAFRSNVRRARAENREIAEAG